MQETINWKLRLGEKKIKRQNSHRGWASNFAERVNGNKMDDIKMTDDGKAASRATTSLGQPEHVYNTGRNRPHSFVKLMHLNSSMFVELWHDFVYFFFSRSSGSKLGEGVEEPLQLTVAHKEFAILPRAAV